MKETTKATIVMLILFAIVLTANSLFKMDIFAQQSTTSTKSERASTPSIDSDIDKTITEIKNGDTNNGKNQLLNIKDKIEENPDTFTGENHIEEAIHALNDGDNNRAIIHVQEAKILNAKF